MSNSKNPKTVLILCTGNSCRSQMAEGIWNKLGKGQWAAHSAGSRPSGYVHPLAVAVMKESGIDVSANRSKSLDEFRGQAFDLVITVCDNAAESCPVFPSAKQMLHWPFPDPADATGNEQEQMPVFRTVRDNIQVKIIQFLASQSV